MRTTQARFWIVLALLLGAAAFLHSRSRPETLPPHRDLDAFPIQLGDWTGRQIYIADDIRQILGNGDFLQRIYTRSANEPAVEFFLAYFPSQRTGSTIHSPKNCLPGSGWEPLESSHTALPGPGGKSIVANRYVLQKGGRRLLVLYWYQSQGRAVASEYWAKFYLVVDTIRHNRSDGALVRVITAQAPEESIEASQARAVTFAEKVIPLLPGFVPE
jgi:EpsI family protein